jgi:hypothetical protein
MKRFNPENLRIHNGYLRTMRPKREYCHRIIWEQDRGAIPDGFHVHHKDGNKLNNLIQNLECISPSDHMRLHAIETREKRKECMKRNSEKVHAWLKTKKGKKFLRDKMNKMKESLPLRKFVCDWCKVEFERQYNKETIKFCSDNCVMRARRVSGIDNVERQCIICLNPFIINKYERTVTCSKPCRAKHIGNLKRKH